MPCPLPYSIFLVCQLRSLTVVFRLPERSRFPPDQHLTNNTKIVWTQWTCDLLITNQLLYQLSYTSIATA